MPFLMEIRHGKSKYTEEQIAIALKQNELGVLVEEANHKMDINEADFL